MAIKNLETNEYFRIIYDKSSIRADKVFVFVQIYLSDEERLKEKNTEREINEAIEKVTLINRNSLAILDSYIDKNKISQDELNQLITSNAEFAAAYSNVVKSSELLTVMGDSFYKLKGEVYSSDINLDYIEEIGINKTLFTNPIIIASQMEVNCGDYNGEEINTQFFYSKLKTMTEPSLKDC